MFYHVTPYSNLETIMKEGVTPSIGLRSLELGETQKRIYLFTSLQACEDGLTGWLGECFEELEDELVILEIDPTGLEGTSEAEYEFATTDIVLPSKIIRILDENLNQKEVYL